MVYCLTHRYRGLAVLVRSYSVHDASQQRGVRTPGQLLPEYIPVSRSHFDSRSADSLVGHDWR